MYSVRMSALVFLTVYDVFTWGGKVFDAELSHALHGAATWCIKGQTARPFIHSFTCRGSGQWSPNLLADPGKLRRQICHRLLCSQMGFTGSPSLTFLTGLQWGRKQVYVRWGDSKRNDSLLCIVNNVKR